MPKKVNIGLDIGVSSVGWSILDSENKVINLGVRLFDDVVLSKDGSKNKKRREKRCSRRLISRKKTRKNDFAKLVLSCFQDRFSSLDEVKSIYDKIDITKFKVDNPVELKVNALNRSIPFEQFIFILFHYLHHRGYFYLVDADDNKDDNKKDINNFEIDKNLTPSQNLLNFYNQFGYYKNSCISRSFSNEDWLHEIEKIFLQQEKNNNFNIPAEFKNKYIELFKRRRDFAYGPGSQKSPSKFGMFLPDGTKREGENLWDSLIGKCTYYSSEKRALKHCIIAELFNFFNDLSNIYFLNSSSKKLNEEIKKEILNEIVNNKNKSFELSPKKLVKIVNANKSFLEFLNKEQITENDINGYRVDHKDKKIITKLENFQVIKNYFLNNQLTNKDKIFESNLDFIEKINNLFNIFAQQLLKIKNSIDPDKEKQIFIESFKDNDNEVIKQLSKNEYDKNLELLNNLSKFSKTHLSKFSKTHSLSEKAMSEYIVFFLSNLSLNDNQQVFFNNNFEKYKNSKKSFCTTSGKYIDKTIFNDEAISPTAKRAFNQAILVFNKILKYITKNKYEIDNVTIEMPRDKNTVDEREKIKQNLEDNKKQMEEILSENKDQLNELSAITKQKLKLWSIQGGYDIYDGKPINKNDLINCPQNYDIDHIIPYSISFDDSLSNKVVTKKHLNQAKSNLTPYYAISSSLLQIEWNKFQDIVKSNIKDSKKLNNLLYQNDPNEDLSDFTGRHLSDTRYASRLVMNTFQEFFKGIENNSKNKNQNHTEVNYGDHVKVKVIRGAITSFVRKKYNIIKNRDIHCHHAIDASIIAYLGANPYLRQRLYHFSKNENVIRYIDEQTGEVLEKEFNLNSNELSSFCVNLKKYNATISEDKDITYDNLEKGECFDKIKFSRMYMRQNNGKLSDELIYSFKWDDDTKTKGHIIKKINLLIAKEDLKNIFNDDSKNFELKKHELYNELKQIWDSYNDSSNINPFILYMQDKNKIIDNTNNNENTNYRYIELKNGNKIKSIRFKSNSKDSGSILKIIAHNSNGSKLGILESLNPFAMRIYKKDDNKLAVVAINANVLTYDSKNNKFKVDNEKLNVVLKDKKITNNTKYIEINRGAIFKDKENGDLWYSIGGGSGGKLEIKSLKYKNLKNKITKKEEKEIRTKLSPSSLSKKYNICEVDELGNIYNEKSIEDFFN